MFRPISIILTGLALSVVLSGCVRRTAAEKGLQSSIDFINWGDGSASPLRKVRAQNINLCVVDDGGAAGDVPTFQRNAKFALLQWYKALRQIDPSVVDNIEQNCNQPDLTVHLNRGGNRSYTSGSDMFLFVDQGDGSILHEFGHAFARLGDTYDTGTGQAGACVQGQPESVMCWGQFGKHDNEGHATLYQDDVAGIQENYKEMYSDLASAHPDVSIDATAPLDFVDPFPMGGGHGTGNQTAYFVALSQSTSSGQFAVYVSAPSAAIKMLACADKVDNCRENATGTQAFVKAAQQPYTGRTLWQSQTNWSAPAAGLASFIGIAQDGEVAGSTSVTFVTKNQNATLSH